MAGGISAEGYHTPFNFPLRHTLPPLQLRPPPPPRSLLPCFPLPQVRGISLVLPSWPLLWCLNTRGAIHCKTDGGCLRCAPYCCYNRVPFAPDHVGKMCMCVVSFRQIQTKPLVASGRQWFQSPTCAPPVLHSAPVCWAQSAIWGAPGYWGRAHLNPFLAACVFPDHVMARELLWVAALSQ